METPQRATVSVERQRLTSLINSMADGVIAVDRDSDIVLYNGAALNILDVNASMEGKPLDTIFGPIDPDNQPIVISELIKDIKTATVSRDYRLRYADGSFINLYLSIAPVHLGYGRRGDHGFVLIFRDITREKSLEEERDEFISVVSHELRTPIAIAEGNISNAQFLAEKQGADASFVKALDEAHRQTLYLADMINDLSTLSRAERGVLEVEAGPINAHDLLQELGKSYYQQATAKGLTLDIDIDPKLEMLYSGRLYVKEILQNYITNAIKYTETGGVMIGAEARPKGVRFWVRDSGIGISKSDQEKVFDKFFRSEDFRTRQNSGTGLGLYVTLKLIKLLHAEVELDSELNKGSTFYVYFPNLT